MKKFTVLCEIEGRHVVSSLTGERLTKARWWHKLLTVFSPLFHMRFTREQLVLLAPGYLLIAGRV